MTSSGRSGGTSSGRAPHRLVKDLHTTVETGAVDRVLDGGFDPFIKAYLMRKAGGPPAAGHAPTAAPPRGGVQ